jgi:hypothetical protein
MLILKERWEKRVEERIVSWWVAEVLGWSEEECFLDGWGGCYDLMPLSRDELGEQKSAEVEL